MKSSVRLAALVMTTAVLLPNSIRAGEPLASGLKPGEKITTIFEPLNVNGPFAGEPHCLVCENGLSPVAMVWARDVGEPLVRLLAKLDAAAVKNAKQEMGSFAVFVGDDTVLQPKLQAVAEKQKLAKLVLAIEPAPGPAEYKLSPEADVTVMFYNEHEVLANHAFRKGELNDAAIEKILADLPKIVGAE
jgi:hypothetical protein